MSAHKSDCAQHNEPAFPAGPCDCIKLEMDGNAWMATRRDFINLQESLAGFGTTHEHAIQDLVRQESEAHQ